MPKKLIARHLPAPAQADTVEQSPQIWHHVSTQRSTPIVHPDQDTYQDSRTHSKLSSELCLGTGRTHVAPKLGGMVISRLRLMTMPVREASGAPGTLGPHGHRLRAHGNR